MKRMRAVESDSVKSARKAKDKLHKACCSRTVINMQIQSHVLLHQGFGTSVPFITFCRMGGSLGKHILLLYRRVQ